VKISLDLINNNRTCPISLAPHQTPNWFA